jgi:hypothetical protein
MPVDPHADPATTPDVRRPEVPDGIDEDHGLLLADRGRQPDRQVIGAVMVIVELREEPAAHPPRGLAPRELFGRLGQRETDRAQPLDRSLAGSAGRPPAAREAAV